VARTFLDLVKRLKQECAIPGAVPSTLVGLTAESEAQRLKDWVADAWFAILELHPDWKFRRRSTSFTTTNGQGPYTQTQCGITANTLGRWLPETFRAYLTSAGTANEYHLNEIDYDEWRNTYLFGANRTAYAQPRFVGVHPETDGLVLGPIPLSGYTIIGDYYLAPTRLSADADAHGLPAQHDDLGIVFKAMIDYGGYEADSAVYQRAQRGYTQFINQLEREQLPRISLCFGMGI
jgi:hypothetical protein